MHPVVSIYGDKEVAYGAPEILFIEDDEAILKFPRGGWLIEGYPGGCGGGWTNRLTLAPDNPLDSCRS